MTMDAAIIIGAGFYIFLREQQLGREDSVVGPPVVAVATAA